MPYDETLAQRTRALLENSPGFSEKKMFGGVGYMIGGNMACGVIGSSLIVRLPPEEYEAALAQPGVSVFDMTGRPMKGWVLVAAPILVSTDNLAGWVGRGLAYARTIPPK